MAPKPMFMMAGIVRHTHAMLLMLLCAAAFGYPGDAFAHENDPHAAVSITNAGYEPAALFIVVGTEVEWTNNDAKERWPASDHHPTHTLYPGSGLEKCGTEEAVQSFDSCRPLSSGESWGFVFGEPGAWQYHDHLFPSQGGVVHIFETERERAAAAEKAEGNQTWFLRLTEWLAEKLRSIKKFFRILPPPEMPEHEAFRALPAHEQKNLLAQLAKYDASRGWEYLKRAAFEEGEQVLEAHELAHIAGNALYYERGFVGIGVCDATFAFGCYHGVAEKFLETEGPEKTAEAAATCRRIFPGEDTFMQYASCVHGLGHGLLTWHALDMHGALSSCGMVPNDVKEHCYDGAFMEFSFSATRAQYQSEDLWSLCENMDETYHVACARYQPELLRSMLGMSTDDIASVCTSAPTPLLREHCISKLGFEAAWQHVENTDGVVSFCTSLFRERDRAGCVAAAAKEFVFQEFPGWREKSAALCDALSGAEQGACTSGRDRTIEEYGR